ncbi:MAG: glycosyltransferase [Parvibaculum sp.]|uniref:glycosyltransferase n=1 Tax=Parvibaculum sp. TaxID=2024848 RepID=UPI0025EF76D3|nr:glycosyltransferase [Parvibaculum sp.]MCE9650778.1 glycosyltransferase [Parvibaculum sp.]
MSETSMTTPAATTLVTSPEISIVIPVYNESANLPLLFERLTAVADKMGRRVEIVFTDDGSKDNSLAILKTFVEKRPDLIRVVEFDRNYGQHMAVMAGFETARGEIIVTLDADLQNPPEEIPKLIAEMDAGHDVVGSYRRDRQDSVFRTLPSRLVNLVRERITGIKMRDQGCMLRAYRRNIVRIIVESGETSTFIPALAQFYAERPAEVEVEHAARHAGTSNYNLYKLIRLNFDLMTGFSLVPLQLFTMVGMGVSGASLLLVVYMLLRRIFIGPEVEGIFTLFAILFFLLGVVITGLGIVGEYVGRIYQQVRARARFRIRTIHEKT